MKTNKWTYLLLMVLFAQACKKDYLVRQPLSNLAPNTFFRNENELMLYTNSFYVAMIPSAETLGYGEFDDNAATTWISNEVQGNRTVPTTGGGWDWSALRTINFYLDNSYKCPDEAARKKYDGVAKFFRAWFYFQKVQRFGDVPWYSHAIEANDVENLTKPRDSRLLVMDSVLADIDYAIANLDTKKSIDKVSKWTALALKSRICLFEGTFRKYHTELNLTGAEKFLDECISASDALISQSGYKIYTSTPGKAYLELFASHSAIASEVILARTFNPAIQVTHDVNRYTNTAAFGQPGVVKTVINSYLMKDGSRFTDIAGYDTMQFYTETQNRDPRLSQTIRTPGYTRIGETKKLAPTFAASLTGYQYIKFVTESAYDPVGLSLNDLPVFRYAEALLNFAEAKAERGTITQMDLNNSVKLLRDRVGMPNVNLTNANATPDPYLAEQYSGVSGDNKGIVLEIRRERRIELIRENLRWNDLMRWKEGHLVTIPFKGMYFPGTGSYDLDNDGKTDVVIYTGTKPTDPGPQYLKLGTDIVLENGTAGGNIITNPGIAKTFNENKDYFYPIPIQELLLNKNLKQNQGWQ